MGMQGIQAISAMLGRSKSNPDSQLGQQVGAVSQIAGSMLRKKRRRGLLTPAAGAAAFGATMGDKTVGTTVPPPSTPTY